MAYFSKYASALYGPELIDVVVKKKVGDIYKKKKERDILMVYT